ncbi:MAG: metallophosphoesterase [Oleiphilaceae bacterium]|nr:metallophosphoesterase [Oleiphilaceae bacterium]
MSEHVQGYDLIGDVHGCAQTLEKLLLKMGYQHENGCFRHDSRKVIFVGDIVDRGPRIREALHIVKNMVDAGQAEIVLGNHEYNAMCYCTRGRDAEDHLFLREHNARNHRQIRETLEQFEPYPEEWQMFLSWFHTIPLYLDKGHFRVVHACWDRHAIEHFNTMSPSRSLSMDMLYESARDGTFLEKMVDRMTRGTSLKLPDGESIVSKDGYIRNMFRTKFWNDDPKTYSDVVFQPDPLPDGLLDRKLSEQELDHLMYYGKDEVPVFVGHYWMSGAPAPITPNVACLDYSAVKYGKLVAYRMDDEIALDANKFVWVDVTPS